MLDVIFKRLNAGKPVLVAEIGVNYYDIARVRGMSLLDAAKAARGTSSSAAKTTAAKKKTTASAAKTTAAKKTSTTAKKDDGYTLTATEKKLIDAYRSASSENRKLALDLLQGKDIETSDASGVSALLQNGLTSGLGGVLETLISGLGKK